MNNLLNNYKRILLIGAGSGADILSSLIIFENLKKEDVKIDLAGFLTPWAVHYFNGLLEKPINLINGKECKKIKLSEKNEHIPFFETYLYEINKKNNLGINNIYLLSLQRGTKILRDNLKRLVDLEKYDLILAVDVGGDILTDKENLKNIFTPIVDLSCLNIFGKLKTDAKKYLAVISPGIDGEIDSKNLNSIIGKYKKSENISMVEEISKLQSNIFLKTLYILKKECDFKSHTPEQLKKIIKKDLELEEAYIKKIAFKDLKVDVKFNVIFNRFLVDNVFYFNLNSIYKKCPIKKDYVDLESGFKLYKKSGVGGTEIDLSYIRNKNNELCFVLNFNYLLNKIQKRKLNSYIKKTISRGTKIIC